MVRFIAAFAILAVSGLATAVTDDDYAQAEERYRGACERAGFTDEVDIIRCVGQSAGWEIDPPETLEQSLIRTYGERCRIAGYQPGSGAFGQCLLAYADRDEASRLAIADRDEAARRAMAAALIGQLYGQQLNQRPIRAALPQPQQAICTSVVGNQLISRPCY